MAPPGNEPAHRRMATSIEVAIFAPIRVVALNDDRRLLPQQPKHSARVPKPEMDRAQLLLSLRQSLAAQVFCVHQFPLFTPTHGFRISPSPYR